MRIKNIFIGLLAVMFFASCGSEFRLANRFVAQSPQVQVAVYFPEAAEVKLVPDDSGEYSRVLDSVDQNQFLDIMYAAYAEELGAYHVNVYIPDNPDQVQVDSLHWLVVLSKVEMQGLYTDYVDQLFDFIDQYEYTFTLNTVNVASWFDVNDGEWHPTVFDEFNLRDEFESHVTNGKKNGTQYHYQITPLKAKDVYDFAVYLGRRYAAFTYDYMMNSFVENAMKPKNQVPRFKLRWDPREQGYYFQLEEEGFVELKTEN